MHRARMTLLGGRYHRWAPGMFFFLKRTRCNRTSEQEPRARSPTILAPLAAPPFEKASAVGGPSKKNKRQATKLHSFAATVSEILAQFVCWPFSSPSLCTWIFRAVICLRRAVRPAVTSLYDAGPAKLHGLVLRVGEDIKASCPCRPEYPVFESSTTDVERILGQDNAVQVARPPPASLRSAVLWCRFLGPLGCASSEMVGRSHHPAS